MLSTSNFHEKVELCPLSSCLVNLTWQVFSTSHFYEKVDSCPPSSCTSYLSDPTRLFFFSGSRVNHEFLLRITDSYGSGTKNYSKSASGSISPDDWGKTYKISHANLWIWISSSESHRKWFCMKYVTSWETIFLELIFYQDRDIIREEIEID